MGFFETEYYKNIYTAAALFSWIVSPLDNKSILVSSVFAADENQMGK